jgi:hypothetical protein
MSIDEIVLDRLTCCSTIDIGIVEAVNFDGETVSLLNEMGVSTVDCVILFSNIDIDEDDSKDIDDKIFRTLIEE